jgi:hypothetical protein
MLANKSFHEIFDGEYALKYMCTRGKTAFHIALTLTGREPWDFTLDARSPGSDTDDDRDEQDGFSWDADVSWTSRHEADEELADAIGSAVFLKLDARKLAEPSYSESESPQVAYDGGGLASVLADLKLASDEIFERLTDALRRVVPIVERVRIQRTKVHHERKRRSCSSSRRLIRRISSTFSLPRRRKRLGFDPTANAHRLNPGSTHTADGVPIERSTKNVVRALRARDRQRERKCWQRTSLDSLHERGASVGLSAFLDDVRARLAPGLTNDQT